MRTISLVAFLAAAASVFGADDFLDSLDETLTISAFQNQVRMRVSGLLDLEYYHFPQPPPGLIRASGHDLFNPRLSLFLDSQVGPHIYFFAQARLDNGFDPSDVGTQLRLDEIAVRLTPWNDGRFNLEVGRFSTIIGGWVERHLSWDNPFVNAPLPYENVTLVSDSELPQTGQSFRAVPAEDKYEFLPIIWGPVYAAGISMTGHLSWFEYAAEMKNAPVASRPGSWHDKDFASPAFDARFGIRPNDAWHFGFSAAEGPYLRSDAHPLEPEQGEGGGVNDYRQFVLGQDISYARGRWQFWAEAFQARFEVPRLGNADTVAYYVETKYKITPQLFGALRWNQQFYRAGRDETGETVVTPPDSWRIDAALGYRFTAHTQLKLQYSLADGDFLSNHLRSTFAAQFTIRF
jgi:hypothetical protein